LNSKLLSVLTERRILVTLILGFSSGLPLALSGSTLQAWYTKSDLSLKALGFMGLAGLPYIYKFVWAPLLDHFVPPFLGRRRGWMLIFQILLAITLFAMSFFNPSQNPTLLFSLAFVLAFFSASQDIAVDAYRTEILHPEERTLGASMVVNGYRTAMLISGGMALVLADHWGFAFTYRFMAVLMFIGVLGTFFSPAPETNNEPRVFFSFLVETLSDFFKRQHAMLILIFLITYELGNAFASSMAQVFLIRELQMSLTEIGSLVKFTGFFGVILGSLLAGMLAIRWNMYRAMLVFGILQALGNLSYLILFWTGPSYLAVGSVIFLDNFTGGMGAAALVGFLMSLCNPRFSAFQYAALSAFVSLGRVFIGPAAGLVAEHYGWAIYFLSSFVLSLPGLYFLRKLRDYLDKITEAAKASAEPLVAEPVS
jgi:PAT family beta-lactamase induction signal transducer AmpG